jgi:uncharacterized protein (DUF1697 family)
MDRYVAFLRGMNLGRRRIKNDELSACFEAMGFANVRTFLASGNVILDTEKTSSARLEAVIESRLGDSLGYAVPTFIRTAQEIVSIVEHVPFTTSELTKSKGKAQVAFVANTPGATARTAALKLSTAADRLAILGRELYWLPQGGLSDSELDTSLLRKILGTMTVRTRPTVERIAGRYLASD